MPQVKLGFCCLVLSLVLCTSTTCAYAKEYYVVPTNSSESFDPPCHTLGYYAANKAQYFVTNSTFLFLPGEHTLDDGTNITVCDSSTVNLRAANYSLCGYSPVQGESPVINCSGHEAGFSFTNVTDLEISGISIINCGQNLYTTNRTVDNETYIDKWSATISLANVTRFLLSDSCINGSHGYGIFGHGVYGNSSIKRCHLKGNRGRKEDNNTDLHGGNIALHYNKSCPTMSHFYVSRLKLLDGYSVSYGGGIDLILNCHIGVIHLEFNEVHLFNNKGYGRANESSSVGIQILALPDHNDSNKVIFNRCQIGGTDFGTGGSAMDIAMYIHSERKSNGAKTITVLEVNESHFQNNTSGSAGPAVHMRLYDSAELTKNKVGVSFHNTHFVKNCLRTDQLKQSSGIAVDIVLYRAGGNSLHSVPQFETTFLSCTFTNNYILNHPSVGSGALYVEEHLNIVLENCTISGNNCTGIAAVHSYLHFRGNNSVMRNTAVRGGGILLADNSVMFLTDNTTLTIAENTANDTGGGIYAEYGSTSAIPLCFFQFDTNTLFSDTRLSTIHVLLRNNNALTGKAVYGGHVDSCYFLVHNTPWINRRVLNVNPGRIFNKTFTYNNMNQIAISSDAVKVCFCENNTAVCDMKTKWLRKSPGETFSVYAVVVGQRQGKTSGIIVAQFFNHHGVKIDTKEETNRVNQSCTKLHYTVSSKNEGISANLSLNVPESTDTVGHAIVELQITTCPLGFILDNSTCNCIKELRRKKIGCITKNHTIDRPTGLWIGYNTHNNVSTNEPDAVIVRQCPHLYCKPFSSHIKAYENYIEQDSQCYLRRRGLLCGQCRKGHSIVFGTPRCLDCHHRVSHWTVLGMVCAFGLAGVLLVAFLIGCNFTVTEGTINGFILYANIVEASQDTYFPLHSSQDSKAYVFLRAFIAWLNLDLGVETCFYNGMKTFDKTFFQFVFPIYIWLITGLLIWLSRRYTLVTRLMKNNGTKVLATLILLSYAKLIRTIKTCLMGVEIGSKGLWFYDASEHYFYGKHMVLFLIAIFFSVLLLPFTFALLFIKHLPRLTLFRTFHWLHKLKPLFDAYTGPYKDEYRFWAGFQLLVRVVVLSFASLKTNNTALLLQIIGVCIVLLSVNYFYGKGIYKKRSTNVIEALLILNLALWSMVSIYNGQLVYHLVYIFVGFTFLQFWVVIICFNVHKPVYYLRVQERCLQKLTHLCLACRERVKSVVTRRGARERDHLLEGSTQPARAVYDELSEPTSSFQSANNEIIF